MLGCGAPEEPPLRDWLHPACRSANWTEQDAFEAYLWETEVLDGLGFAFGLRGLIQVDAQGYQHYMPPIGKVEEIFRFEGALWASDWREGLAVCESEGWRQVDAPGVLQGSGDQFRPMVLDGDLALLRIQHATDGCDGDCHASYVLYVDEGDWTSIVLPRGPESQGSGWVVYQEQLLFREGYTEWQRFDGEGLVPADPIYPGWILPKPGQDWMISQDDGWFHGPLGAQEPLDVPEHHGAFNGAFRRLEIIAPEHYILADAAQGWEYKDGAWTELSFVPDSRPGSGVAVDGGILMLWPLQWITPEQSVEIPLGP